MSTNPGWFTTTHWSVVVRLGDDSTEATNAFAQLYRAYWYPLYAYMRRLGYRKEEAEDLVQAFFARCLEKDYLLAADQAKGKFRSFLLVLLKRFLANAHDRRVARKRGEGKPNLELDSLTAEQRYKLEPPEIASPERLYERRWALTLLERVLRQLEEEQHAKGSGAEFSVLRDCLASGGAPYAELARQLDTSEGAVKVAVHRLRKRYRELLEAEIGSTVASPEEIEEERRYLLSVLSS